MSCGTALFPTVAKTDTPAFCHHQRYRLLSKMAVPAFESRRHIGPESSTGQQGVQTIIENMPRRIGQSLRRHPEFLLPRFGSLPHAYRFTIHCSVSDHPLVAADIRWIQLFSTKSAWIVFQRAARRSASRMRRRGQISQDRQNNAEQ